MEHHHKLNYELINTSWIKVFDFYYIIIFNFDKFENIIKSNLDFGYCNSVLIQDLHFIKKNCEIYYQILKFIIEIDLLLNLMYFKEFPIFFTKNYL